jgi:hypothetical protein
MPRSARSCPPGTFQHVISEFVDREYWLADETDRRKYLSLVSRCVGLYDGLLLVRVVGRAYGVTPESVHNSRARWHAVASARRVLAHIARDCYGLGFRQIAERMSISNSGARQLAMRPLAHDEQDHAAAALRAIAK